MRERVGEPRPPLLRVARPGDDGLAPVRADLISGALVIEAPVIRAGGPVMGVGSRPLAQKAAFGRDRP